MMSYKTQISKENMDFYLNEIAKEYKNMGRNMPPIEVIIVGGASIVANYDFRGTTTDIDCSYFGYGNSAFKDAVNKVTDRYGLDNNWFNSDYAKTSSYSPRLREKSKYYKRFCNLVEVRSIKDETLIAMKIKSSRIYKKDLSDIIGILKESSQITYNKINEYYEYLYNEKINKKMEEFLNRLFSTPDLDGLYEKISKEEKYNKDILKLIEINCENNLNSNNVDEFIQAFKQNERIIDNQKSLCIKNHLDEILTIDFIKKALENNIKFFNDNNESVFNNEQIYQIKRGVQDGLKYSDIFSYMNPNLSVEEMEEKRNILTENLDKEIYNFEYKNPIKKEKEPLNIQENSIE